MDDFKIREEPHEIDEHLLDIIENSFKFSHEKGLAEWLKNSVDAYIRNGTPDESQVIVLNFLGVTKPTYFECIDFCGMTKDDIVKAFKRWGDPKAAKRGTEKLTFGGHGNGGKFYMRAMFQSSHFITYKNGRLNVFGFNKNKKYGFAAGYEDKKESPYAAVEFARLNKYEIPQEKLDEIYEGKTGFTIVRGFMPKRVLPGERYISQLCTRLSKHPQAAGILRRTKVVVLENGKLFWKRLEPEKIAPYPGLEQPQEIPVPEKITGTNEDGDKEDYVFQNKKYTGAKLTLYTSAEPLTGMKLGDLNRIDIKGKIGVIGSYKIYELGSVKNPAAAQFIYGECYCPILEDEDEDCVQNDREKLVPNKKVETLLNWIGNKVDEIGYKIIEDEVKKEQNYNNKTLQDYNDLLDKWKNQFISSESFKTLFVGKGTRLPAADKLIGGHEHIGTESGGRGDGVGIKEGDGVGIKEREKKEDKGGEKPRKTHSAPRVLLSSIDPDPLSPANEVLHLHERQAAVYQRPQDVKEGIYWINTSRKMAKKIMDDYGVESTEWRNYHLQRYIDIVMKIALRELYKNYPESFTPDQVDTQILDQVVMRLHDSAVENLGEFLFKPDTSGVNKKQTVFSVVKSNKGLSVKEIAKETGFDASYVRVVLYQLFREGKVDKKKGENGRVQYY